MYTLIQNSARFIPSRYQKDIHKAVQLVPSKPLLALLILTIALCCQQKALALDECWQTEVDKSTLVLQEVMALHMKLEKASPEDMEHKTLTCQYWNARINYSKLRVKAAECPGNSDEALEIWNKSLKDDTKGAAVNECPY